MPPPPDHPSKLLWSALPCPIPYQGNATPYEKILLILKMGNEICCTARYLSVILKHSFSNFRGCQVKPLYPPSESSGATATRAFESCARTSVPCTRVSIIHKMSVLRPGGNQGQILSQSPTDATPGSEQVMRTRSWISRQLMSPRSWTARRAMAAMAATSAHALHSGKPVSVNRLCVPVRGRLYNRS